MSFRPDSSLVKVISQSSLFIEKIYQVSTAEDGGMIAVRRIDWHVTSAGLNSVPH